MSYKAKYLYTHKIYCKVKTLHRINQTVKVFNFTYFFQQKGAETVKIIFLDIDGVLKEDKQGAPFLDVSLALLETLVKKTGAKLVMSSTWKTKYKNFIDSGKTEFADIKRLFDTLKAHGLEIYDSTPLLKETEKPLRRPAEIRAYLASTDNVDSFCIIDDRSEFEWAELESRLVLTFIGKDENGEKVAHLTQAHAEKAERILNEKQIK